ncbi:MAG: division/cell wall cluster transcriptional repressor MraZ [bacterium]|nr:MAG: division/cell wall cluster transcriptional repressor MraZ [bacterium]
MPIFIGEFFYTLDDKGRVNIPAKFRRATSEDADSTYIIQYGRDRCLYIYPMDVYEKKIIDIIDKLSEADPLHRAYMSLLGSKSIDATLDKQGRITIPLKFLDFAGIKKEVHIIGAYNRIEVWEPKIREQYVQEIESSGIDLEEKISNEINQ